MRKRTQRNLAPRRTVDPTAHFASRIWGSRKARTRGIKRIATDADTRAAALNWSRLDVLGVHWNGATWAAAGP